MRQNQSKPDVQCDVTRRQAQIINLVLAGFGSDDIGQSLGIARQTLRNHMRPVFQKFGVRNRAELIIAVLRLQKIRLGRIIPAQQGKARRWDGKGRGATVLRRQ
jgi:DNA-binding CsgD family transcriptional regulator